MVDLVKPEHGYEFVPPEGTVPRSLKDKLSIALMRKLFESGCQYDGQTNS
jgi:hypothetical protein